MYSNVDVTPEEESEYVEKAAQKIVEYGMETAAILALESSKPLVYVGGEMGRFFITPFIPVVSETWGVKSEKLLLTFEKRENIEKLLVRIEEITKENQIKVKEQKALEKARKIGGSGLGAAENQTEQSKNKKPWWRRFFPG